MNYFLAVFSPDTHPLFTASDRTVMGFRDRHRKAAGRVGKGDVLVCYLTGLSRWVGILRVTGAAFDDATPRFADQDDPFTLRLPVESMVWLPAEQGIPIHDSRVWSALSFTKSHPTTSSTWTGSVRTSLAPLQAADGAVLTRLLKEQATKQVVYPLEPAEVRAMKSHVVRRAEGEVRVSVPQDVKDSTEPAPLKEVRESIKVQTLLAEIGRRMRFKVWVPASDRGAIIREQPELQTSLLDKLPLNYDTTTLQTIENIDVLWLKGRSMARAFEVEHTTAIYSGILRMADLLALQPNMEIRLHIVAPESRRAKVFEEIRRPVFSLLEGRPLAKRCTFLSYDSVREIAALEHLDHLSDSVLDEYVEDAEG